MLKKELEKELNRTKLILDYAREEIKEKDKEIEFHKNNERIAIDCQNKLNEETERLNNIINEIEKYLIEEIEDYDKHINSQYITDNAREQYEGEKVCFEDMLGELQELKGDDKE